MFGLAGWGIGLAGCRRVQEPLGPLVVYAPPPKDPVGWPQWRGKNACGIASGGSPAIHFSASQAVRWRAEVPGEGNSSPVVWDDFVLLTTALPETEPPTLAILGYNRADGQLCWQTPVGQAQGRTHVKNGYASATPATDGQRVFAFFGSTGLFCCDLSGRPIWRAELGDLDHQWGTAASPILYGDLVIQLCDAQRNSYIAAFDKQTGKRVWRRQRSSYGCWSTPVLVEAEAHSRKRIELVVNGGANRDPQDRRVIAYDPASGQELWRVSGTTELVIPTIIAGSGLVFSTSGRNGPIMAIRPGGSGDVTQTHVVWSLPRGGPYIPTGLVYRDRLYVLTDYGQLTCYGTEQGQVVWTRRLRGQFSASLVAADGRIYAASEQGVVYVLAAGDQGELFAQNHLGSRILATPAIASGELFIRTQGHLYCIAASQAAAAWP